MKISACIITKNEASKLEKCLQSLKDVVDEIVVTDTGSSDNTLEIMEKYADVSGNFLWCNHFAMARNYCVSLASNDWILVLDSDEWIEKFEKAELYRIFENNEQVLGRIGLTNYYHKDGQAESGQESICRLFNRKYYEYQGRIHEQIVRKDGSKSEIAKAPIMIGHSGYDGTPEEKKRKAARNIELLLLDLSERGDDPYILYQLGKSYYMQQQYEKAAESFERGLGFDLEPALEYVQDMVETYGYTLLQLGRREEMMFLQNIYEEFALSADYVLLMGLAYMNNGFFEEAIAEFEKATTFKNCKIEGCNSYKAYYNAGVVCECLNRNEKAGQYYRKCGNYQPAIDGLKRLKQC